MSKVLAYEEGSTAYLSNKHISKDNPYPLNTAKYHAWRNGFDYMRTTFKIDAYYAATNCYEDY